MKTVIFGKGSTDLQLLFKMRKGLVALPIVSSLIQVEEQFKHMPNLIRDPLMYRYIPYKYKWCYIHWNSVPLSLLLTIILTNQSPFFFFEILIPKKIMQQQILDSKWLSHEERLCFFWWVGSWSCRLRSQANFIWSECLSQMMLPVPDIMNSRKTFETVFVWVHVYLFCWGRGTWLPCMHLKHNCIQDAT